MTAWLSVHRGTAPLLLSMPHTGVAIDPAIERRMQDPWRARKDADYAIDQLYSFASHLGATIIRTSVSRTVIDVNRDPSGTSLYPAQATTGLCPETTFDGEPLYCPGTYPDATEIEDRTRTWFQPYHEALSTELTRLRSLHPRVVLYDAHAIRSRVPRMFDGTLPHANIGTADGQSCAPALSAAVLQACAAHDRFTHILDGRFKGGWITRHHGRPEAGIHAIQMELAFSGFVAEPDTPSPATWPPLYDDSRAAPMRAMLADVLRACLDFAGGPP